MELRSACLANGTWRTDVFGIFRGQQVLHCVIMKELLENIPRDGMPRLSKVRVVRHSIYREALARSGHHRSFLPRGPYGEKMENILRARAGRL